MKLGTMVHMRGADLEDKIRQVHENGFETCQICCWNGAWLTGEAADRIRALCETYHVEISTFWCGWSGPGVWDFAEGPLTLGLVPPEYRFARMEELKRGSDFAKRLGTENIATHVGFLPEVSGSGEYRSVVAALKHVAHYVKANGQYFLFETGQETPVTLLRTIEDIGTDNLGINLDPANLILYGKANPVDALDVFGKYVRDVHAKDGLYPTDGKHLGRETPLGEGKVDFPRLIAKLREVGYDGSLTIEREISGEQQLKDILRGKALLEELI